MHSLLPQPQQDFFLYVPAAQQERGAVQAVSDTACQAVIELPTARQPWIKIPLADSLVVYASVWDRASGQSE